MRRPAWSNRPSATLLSLVARDEKCWVKITGLERLSRIGPPLHDEARSRGGWLRPTSPYADERASHTDVQQNVAVDSKVRQTGPGGGE
jgi:hypothetical protein